MRNKFIFFIIISSVLTLRCSDIPDYKESGKVLPEGTISINDNHFYTQSVNANINLDVDNADEMCFSTDGTTYTAWEPYSATKSVTLPSGHGQKTVYGKFRNTDGESVITDTIIQLDEVKIVAGDGVAGANFGGGNWSHTTANVTFTYDGNTMITSSSNQNEVYVYTRNNNLWDETIIPAPDIDNMYFGQSIACTPDAAYIAVGDLGRNRIYIFKKTGIDYTLERRIDAPSVDDIQFAVTVSISDDGKRIIAGSWRYNTVAGRAILYEKTGANWNTFTWTPFSAPGGGVFSDMYGLGVKISGNGNTIVISAPGRNSQVGSLFIYKWNGSIWSFSEIISSDTTLGQMLGRHIGISYDGTRIVAGTKCWNPINHNQGAAYLFEWDGSDYIETFKFIASDGMPDDLFGYSVAMSYDGNSVFIGSPLSQAAVIKGKAYVFRYRNSAWIEEAILDGSDSAAGEFYGNVTAISGDGSVMAVSSSLDTIGVNSQQGSVYLYY